MIETFGQFEENEVKRVTLRGGGLTAHVLNYGACLQDLRLEGHDGPLVLGYERFDDYLNHSPYFGASVGRFANRIKDGRFQIEGKSYQLDQNEESGNHLHGGVFRITYESETDQSTIANIAHHSYFNLDGSDNVYDHELQINADSYLAIDDGLIPIGAPDVNEHLKLTRHWRLKLTHLHQRIRPTDERLSTSKSVSWPYVVQS